MAVEKKQKKEKGCESDQTLSDTTRSIQSIVPESAIEKLKKRQHEHLLCIIQENLQAECDRNKKISRAKDSSIRERLEKMFDSERERERLSIQRLKEDQIHVLQNAMKKISLNQDIEPKTQSTNRLIVDPNRMQMGFNVSSHRDRNTGYTAEDLGSSKNKSTAGIDDQALQREINNIRAETARLSSTRRSGRATGTNVQRRKQERLQADTVQASSFYKTMYAKSDKVRNIKSSGTRSSCGFLPPLSEKSLYMHATRSEKSLLRKKHNLLSQLHDVVAQQERIVMDDASTIRSSVSSFKSSQYGSPRSVKTAKYIPFENV